MYHIICKNFTKMKRLVFLPHASSRFLGKNPTFMCIVSEDETTDVAYLCLFTIFLMTGWAGSRVSAVRLHQKKCCSSHSGAGACQITVGSHLTSSPSPLDLSVVCFHRQPASFRLSACLSVLKKHNLF